MNNLPDAFLSHKIQGRVRLKIPSKKGDLLYFKNLKDQLLRFNGIERLEVNPVSGSILIHTSDLEKIAEYARDKNIFALKNNRPRFTNIYFTVSKIFKDTDRKVRGITGGDMDIAGLAFISLLGLGIYQISRGNFAAPAWYTAFWYALNIFLKSGNKGAE